MKTILSIVVCVYFFSPSLAQAYVMRVAGEQSGSDTPTEIRIMLDTEGEAVNAVEGRLHFDPKYVSLTRVDDSESICNFWITKPDVDASPDIPFSCITPGGFTGVMPIFSVYVRALGAGEVTFSLEDLLVLANDGNGTSLQGTAESLTLALNADVLQNEENLSDDDELPEPFTVAMSTDPDVFSSAPYLVFATEDKGSGIDRYYVKEGFFSWYRSAESPYKIRAEWLPKKIYVKAVDHAGNERVEIFYPLQSGHIPDRDTVFMCILLILVCLFLAVSYRSFGRRRVRS